MTNGETWRNKKRCHLCSLPWGEDYPWRKCDRHCGSAAEEMWAYRFWPWPLGMSVSSVSEIQKMMSLQVAHIRGSYYALWCLEVGDVWWKILIRVNKHLWYEWDDSIQGWCWFGTWDDANLNLQSSGLDTEWCVLHLRHSQMTKCQPESINQIYPSQQSKCLGVFSKTHFSRISRAKEFSKENQNLLFLVTAPWTWNMTLPFSFSQRHRLLTPVRIVEVMWVGLGAGSPGLVDGTLWMRHCDAKWLNFFGTWIPSSLGLLRGAKGIVLIFFGHHEYETNNCI